MQEEMRERFLSFFARRRNYARAHWMQPAGRQVLADLEPFCCASITTARGNKDDILIREGRRQVWLRIQRAINLTAEEHLAIMSEKDNP